MKKRKNFYLLIPGLLFFLMGIRSVELYEYNSNKIPITDSIVTDFNGNVYNVVKIGEQVWLKENLKVTHYRDGTPILQVSEEAIWSELKTGAYCVNEDNPEEYKRTYGLLYNYYAVSNAHNICPDGWHIPSREEWLELEDFLGGQSVAGGKMKDVESGLWQGVNEGNNDCGFSGLPAGGRGRLGKPGDVGYFATWWSSTSHDSLYAWHWGLYPDKNSTRKNPGHKTSGFSVRCIKD